MKKLLLVLCSMLIIAGLTTAAFAVHPGEPAEKTPMISKGKTAIELGGSLRFRGEYKKDIISLADGSSTENDAKYDGRVRLHINAYATENTMGRVNLETGSDDKSDTYTWGCANPETKGIYQEGNCKKGELRVLEAFIQHEGKGLLGMPAGIKIGHMPIKLGRGLFLNHSKFGEDAINLFINPSDNLSVEFVAVKVTEGGSSNADDDSDAYALILNSKAGAVNVGGDVTFLRDKDLSGDDGTDLWNIAVRADSKINDIKVYGEFDLQTGKFKSATSNKDFSGIAGVLGANMKVGDFGVNAEVGYGSGDDNTADNDYDQFVTAQHGSQKFTYIYDYRLATAATNAATGASLNRTDTGIANTTYLKVGADAKPMKDLKTALNLYWLKASEKVLLIDGTKEDDLGVEVDFNLAYQIDTNLEYFVEGGILFAGDIYEKTATSASNNNFDDPWAVRHGIQLAF
ncbi:MAG: hypothetical protein C4526_00395 [Nitrospiraceae bacterium]|nr:MAG: hypothetical protein C4526_00395 [Nitrospiraceae bacterium]